MKKNLFQLSLLFLSCTASLCGCTEGDEPIAATDGTTLTIRATADGFTSADSADTRASENGYTATFTAGDEIGVFAVKDGAVIADCKNVKCTYDAKTKSWSAEASAPVYYYTGAEYFAYYPYKIDLNTDNITTVDGIVSAFSTYLADDQSTYAKYTACDLMTADAVSPTAPSGGNKTLSFSFAHKMSLIEISLPVSKYKTSELPDAYEYSSPVLGATFSITKGSTSTITPYNISKGIYRYIVPAGTSYTVSGTFSTVDSKTIEYSKEVSSLSSGNYKRLNVTYDGAPSSTAEVRALVVGDFYYSDGSICPGNVSNPPREGCIGVVMKVGKDSDDDCTYKQKDGTTEMNTVNGYVLALYDANGGNTCEWGSYGTQVEYIVDNVDMMNREEIGFYGYKNTQAVILFAASENKTLKTDFPAVYWTTDATEGYEYSYPAPANSSGWFLPSAGQCNYWLYNRDELLTSVRKATGADSYGWKNYYWSSSEYSSRPTNSAWYASFSSSNVSNNNKDNRYYVRACLAF